MNNQIGKIQMMCKPQRAAAPGCFGCLHHKNDRAVSVEWSLLNPDWFGSRRRFRDSVSMICLKTALSMVSDSNWRNETRQKFPI